LIKKVFILLISGLLLFSSLGITVKMHYCGNNLVLVYFSGKVKSCCGENCKSCHTKAFQLKVIDNYVISFMNTIPDFTDYLAYIYQSDLLNSSFNSDIQKIFYPDSSPPLYKQLDTFLEVFRL
jgi:hypothetical protein